VQLSVGAKRVMGIATIGAMGLLAWPTASHAATMRDGDDYAYNTGITKLTTCDGEADGHSVYSDYAGGSTSGRNQTAGGSGTCAPISVTFTNFNVCEQIPAFPDSCSSKAYL
jgi:hypothetical protein